VGPLYTPISTPAFDRYVKEGGTPRSPTARTIAAYVYRNGGPHVVIISGKGTPEKITIVMSMDLYPTEKTWKPVSPVQSSKLLDIKEQYALFKVLVEHGEPSAITTLTIPS